MENNQMTPNEQGWLAVAKVLCIAMLNAHTDREAFYLREAGIEQLHKIRKEFCLPWYDMVSKYDQGDK
jgi:hypothetical protein